jgi:hypothetical protein
MDLEGALVRLREERDRLHAAILRLEHLHRLGNPGSGLPTLAAKSRPKCANGDRRPAGHGKTHFEPRMDTDR